MFRECGGKIAAGTQSATPRGHVSIVMTMRRIGSILAVGGLCLFASGPAWAKNYSVDGSAAGCVPAGAKGGGGAGGVYCTIQAAVDAAFADGGGEVDIAPGVYPENVVLHDGVSLRGNAEGVIIELPGGPLPLALVQTANDSRLRLLTLRLPEGAAAAVPLIGIFGVENIEMDDLILDGGFNRGSVGVLVESQALATSRIRTSTLQGLEVGVIAEDTTFRITRCLFTDLLRDGIWARPPSGKIVPKRGGDTPNLGDNEDLELSGFNRFRNIGGFLDNGGNVINEGDSFFLRNTTGFPLTAQINDWGLYDTAEIAARISDQPPAAKGISKASTTVTYEPYLGKSLFPGSVYVRVRDAASLTALADATVQLLLNAIDTHIKPAYDTVSKLYSFTFINPNTYSVNAVAPGHDGGTGVVSVLPADIAALELRLAANVVPTSYNSSDTNQDGAIDLSEILRIIQFYNLRALHCDATTEDGFAPGAGGQACAPHNADYNPTDWTISLSELLRQIQLYNSVGYHACPEGEDGFCLGPAA